MVRNWLTGDLRAITQAGKDKPMVDAADKKVQQTLQGLCRSADLPTVLLGDVDELEMISIPSEADSQKLRAAIDKCQRKKVTSSLHKLFFALAKPLVLKAAEELAAVADDDKLKPALGQLSTLAVVLEGTDPTGDGLDAFLSSAEQAMHSLQELFSFK